MKANNIKSTIMSVESIMKDYKKPITAQGKLFFDLNSQRSSGMWTTEWKSDLIHSLLQGYYIPDIHIIATGTKNIRPMSVIDGKQRITSTREFVLGVFALSKTTPPVFLPEVKLDSDGHPVKRDDGIEGYVYESVEYPIAGKKFSQLPENLRELLLSSNFNVILYDGMTEREIAIQMERLNRQRTFNGTQRANVIIGETMAQEVEEATKNELFENRVLLTDRKKNSGELKKMIFQSLALYTGKSPCSLNSSDLEKYMRKNKINKETITKVKDILDDIDSMLPRTSKVNENMSGINIPILVMNYDKYEQMLNDGEITRQDYIDFLTWWFEEGINSDEYQMYVDKDAQNRGKVSGRIQVMDEALKQYMNEMPI